MEKLRIKGWQEWQTYRKDRGTPPWIKVHRCLMSCEKWATLSDAEKGQLVSIWIIAADNNGQVPSNPKTLKKICQLDEEPNIKKLMSLRLLEDCQPSDNQVATTCQPSDAPETETETEKKQNNKYAFNGEIVKVTQKDFDNWLSVFDLVPDLKSFLYAKDLYFSTDDPQKGKNWFMRTSALLKKEQEKYALIKKEQKAEEEKDLALKRKREAYQKTRNIEEENKQFLEGLE